MPSPDWPTEWERAKGKLSPCPFCGDADIHMDGSGENLDVVQGCYTAVWHGTCHGCDTYGPSVRGFTCEGAIAAWNKRTGAVKS